MKPITVFIQRSRVTLFLAGLFLGLTSLYAGERDQPDSLLASHSGNDKQFYYSVSPTETIIYQKPVPYRFLLDAPKDVIDYTTQTLRLSNWKNIAGMTALTAFFVVIDQDITDRSKDIGRAIGIKGDNNMKSVVNVLGFPIQMPTDLSSTLYFIGDGWTNIFVNSSFLTYGLIKSDARALQTSAQMAEGLIAVTFFTQFLKHVTGRESPFVATRPGGRWDLFPDQIEYHKHVPKYDAFPSGHVAAFLTGLTVISDNYPEYKFIKPVGYTLLTILSYQMLNNGVHWFSDYPLALAMGYSIGKMVVSRHQKVLKRDNNDSGFVDSINFGFGRVNRDGIGIHCTVQLK